MRYVIVFFLGIVFFLTRQAVAQGAIRINEFLIEPTPQQVEIINIGTESADISGWYIDDSGGATYYTIPPLNILYPNSCLVFSGDFNLNKSSADTVRLLRSTDVIDSFSYKSSSGSGIAYLRLPDGTNNWTTGSANLGLFNESGASCIITPTLTPTPTSVPTQTPIPSLTFTPVPTVSSTLTPTITPTSYQNIYISEAMVNPPSGENEWIELFNNNDYSVSLINWYIDDIENGGSSPKLFSLDIPTKSYGVIDLSSPMFNNTGDSVRLLDFNKNHIDDFEYASTTQGKTFGRISYDSDEFCLQDPSKNQPNNSCINPILTHQPTPTKVPTPSKIPTPPNLSATAVTNRLIPSASIYRYINTNMNSWNNVIREGDVLGASRRNTIKTYNRLIHPLLFLSFSYSLLTIFSLFLRMKIRYEKNR